jgi:hypothetical protein
LYRLSLRHDIGMARGRAVLRAAQAVPQTVEALLLIAALPDSEAVRLMP